MIKINFNEEQIKDIIQRYNNGETILEISNLYKLSITPIRKLLIKNNVPMRMKSLTLEQHSEIIKQYQDGKNIMELAKDFNVSNVSISYLLKKYNISSRGRWYGYEENDHKTYDNLKGKCFDHYGRICKNCSENIIQFLSFHHINNDGSIQRNEEKITGVMFLNWVIDNNFPDTIQTMCHNCNWIKYLETLINNDNIITPEKRYRDRVRYEIMEHYSNGKIECSCCHIFDMRVLTLEHDNGGGKLERTSLGGGTMGFYMYLYQNNYPVGYSVLCRNCNTGKWLNYGVCPHKIM